MGKIKVIDEVLANKIAAGEVVERPASIVRELVENSLDAGADCISIDIIDGGKHYIKVADNGEGMSEEDAALSFERHATSKIRKDEDLFSISTLGFRGEALPSIASVAKVEVATKIKGAVSGVRLSLKNGKVFEVIESGCPEGTAIEIKDLFYNTPARYKFLKGNNTELGHIIDTVTRYTFSHPDVRFTLRHKGKTILKTLKGKDMKTRVSEVMDRDAARGLIEFKGGSGEVKIHGFVSSPEYSLPNRKGQFTYVNKRWVRDRLVTHAITEGCRPFFMKDRFPVVIIFLNLPTSDVDVNVHPAKREVRFKNTNEIHRLTLLTLRDGLSSTSYVNSLRTSALTSDGRPLPYPSLTPSMEHSRVGEPVAPYMGERQDSGGNWPLLFDNIRRGTFEGRDCRFLHGLDIIGQLWDSYVICQDGESLILMDQHAAHERIAFERLKKEYYSSEGLKGEPLLIPQVVELSPKEMSSLDDALKTFMAFGIEIEPFGGNEFVIKTLPQILTDKDCRGLVKDILYEVFSTGKGTALKDAIDNTLITMACHSVIRGRRTLDKREIEALLKDLEKVDIPGNCPHGRPIFKCFSRSEIEGFFKR